MSILDKVTDAPETACSIANFCKRYGISKATYYRDQSSFPRTVWVGSNKRILKSDEDEWLKSLESGDDISKPRGVLKAVVCNVKK
mgnify:CR=1 FL=1